MTQKEPPYYAQAARKFLRGLRSRSPAEAVETGKRTIEAWCDALVIARAESLDGATLGREDLIAALLKSKARTVLELAEILEIHPQLVSRSIRILKATGRAEYVTSSLIASRESDSEERF
jgi:DNA-binding MarR family transcriptional regulator